MTVPKYVLSIAGSDSSGGAGMQADNRAIHACGAFPLNVLTAVTVQTPRGVEAVEVLSAEFVARQLRSLLEAYPVAAIKSGMLTTSGIVRAVGEVLALYPEIPYILDPVLCSTSGEPLLDTEGVALLREVLLPRATLITPNHDEFRILSGDEPGGGESVRYAGTDFSRRLNVAVLVKGGHAEGDLCADCLCLPNGDSEVFSAARVATRNTRGTGCALSALIAAELALGGELRDAVARAKNRLTGSMAAHESQSWTGAGPAFLS